MVNQKNNTVTNLVSPLGDRGYRRLNYLEQLEAESIHIFREMAAQFERPAYAIQWR